MRKGDICYYTREHYLKGKITSRCIIKRKSGNMCLLMDSTTKDYISWEPEDDLIKPNKIVLRKGARCGRIKKVSDVLGAS